MNGDEKFRVYNRCKHDIGVSILNGQQTLNIKSGGFVMLSVNDIFYIESICNKRKFFSAKMLVPVDSNGKDLALEDLGGYSAEDIEVHFNDDEIEANLKKPYKAFEAWMKKIEDPSELFAIAEIAKKLDLPASKLKVLKAKLPNKDLLGDE